MRASRPAVRAAPLETPSGALSTPLDAALTPPLALHTTGAACAPTYGAPPPPAPAPAEWLVPLSPTPALAVPSALGRALRRTPGYGLRAGCPGRTPRPAARPPGLAPRPACRRRMAAPSAAPRAPRAVGRAPRSASSPPHRSELVKAPPPLGTTAGSSSRGEQHFGRLFGCAMAAIDRRPGRLRR
ncbi:eukaryotic translation initiation factor 3 subunit F [Triticum aestivum]|uniref:eukaryotic translation initiation factor 3 subunit F n=1 Tax=Triticum aestivum TaxID=4565 RepID=UPI001D02A59D|nr:eukaryotic translation initiation factor 3 subunit F-like [Triticum aestivum]XP_044420308.1 eukaryotic translation initiation factor 3 subunit F-like [Triticum aestivum]